MMHPLQNLSHDVTSAFALGADVARPQSPPRATDGMSFEQQMEKATEKLKVLADMLVASTLVLPMLKQMHNDPFKSDMFHGGFGEDVFAAQLDEELADRMTTSQGLPIARILTEQFTEQIKGRPDLVKQAANMRVDTLG